MLGKGLYLSVLILTAGLLGGCPQGGVNLGLPERDASGLGLIEGVYSGVVAIDQTIQGLTEERVTLEVNTHLTIDRDGNIVHDGTPVEISREILDGNGVWLWTYRVTDLHESQSRLVVTSAARADSLDGQVQLTGRRTDTYDQLDASTIQFRQTIAVGGEGLLFASSAEATFTR